MPKFQPVLNLDSIAPTTAKGDLIVRSSSTNARLGVGSDGQVLTADSAQSLGVKWAGVSGAAYSVVSKSANYTAVANDYILASGASFAVTLPTAVGVSGQSIVIQHAGTSFSQVYTLNTTSSQTIGGIASGSYILNTNSEVLVVVSDGANWQIQHHQTATAWTAYTPTFTGFGTVSTQAFYWRRFGDSVQIRGTFTSGTATATEARISLPGSITSSSNIGTLELLGTLGVNTAGTTFFSDYCSIEPSVAYFTMTKQDSTQNNLAKQNGSGIASAGSHLAVVPITISISGWQP